MCYTCVTRYRRCTQQQWANVIFLDESSFPIEKCDKMKRVFRRVNEIFADGCIQSADDRRSVMVWGAISIRGKTSSSPKVTLASMLIKITSLLLVSFLFLMRCQTQDRWNSSTMGRPFTRHARRTSSSVQTTYKSWVLGRLNRLI